MNFSASWSSYLGMLTQAVGVGGVLVFGFVASWIFGREYSDATVKDLLSLPTSRREILNGKFLLYVLWSCTLAVSNLLMALIIGFILQLPVENGQEITGHLGRYALTTALTVLLGPPISFFALWGKGDLAPLGFVCLTLVLAQIIAAVGVGYYFPWSIPGLFSGMGGEVEQLNFWSYAILIATALIGYVGSVWFWNISDQVK